MGKISYVFVSLVSPANSPAAFSLKPRRKEKLSKKKRRWENEGNVPLFEKSGAKTFIAVSPVCFCVTAARLFLLFKSFGRVV